MKDWSKGKKLSAALICAALALWAVGTLPGVARTLWENLYAPARAMKDAYYDAMKEREGGRYDAAILIFTDLGGYRDAAEMATDCRFKKGQRLYEEGRYPEAYAAYYTAGGCQDAEERPAGPGEGGA